MKQTKIAVSKLHSFENNPYQVRDDAETVSYTHLTLPTILLV